MKIITDEGELVGTLDDRVLLRQISQLHEDENESFADSGVKLDQVFVVDFDEEGCEVVDAIVLDDNSNDLSLGERDDATVDEDWRIEVVSQAQIAQLEVKVDEVVNRLHALVSHPFGKDLAAADDCIFESREHCVSSFGGGELDHPVVVHRSDAHDLVRLDIIFHRLTQIVGIEVLWHVVQQNMFDFVGWREKLLNLLRRRPQNLDISIPQIDRANSAPALSIQG